MLAIKADAVINNAFLINFWLNSFILVPIVFLIVLASGYYKIMRNLWSKPKLDQELESETGIFQEKNPGQVSQNPSDSKSWEEVGLEFRMMYLIFSTASGTTY